MKILKKMKKATSKVCIECGQLQNVGLMSVTGLCLECQKKKNQRIIASTNRPTYQNTLTFMQSLKRQQILQIIKNQQPITTKCIACRLGVSNTRQLLPHIDFFVKKGIIKTHITRPTCQESVRLKEAKA